MMIPQNLEDNSVVATWEFNSEHRLKEEGATKNLCHKEIVQKLGRNKFVPQNNCATKTFKTDFINLCFIVGSTEGVLCCACNWARLPFQYLNLKTQKLSIYLWVVPCCTFLRWLPMVWCLLNKNCLRIFVAPSSATSSSGQHLNNTSLRSFSFLRKWDFKENPSIFTSTSHCNISHGSGSCWRWWVKRKRGGRQTEAFLRLGKPGEKGVVGWGALWSPFNLRWKLEEWQEVLPFQFSSQA